MPIHNLTVSQARGVQRWKILEGPPEGPRLVVPLPESLRTVEGEDLARAGLWVAGVGEPRDDARRLVDEGQRLGVLHPLQLSRGISGGLRLDGRNPGPQLSGFASPTPSAFRSANRT